MGWKQKDSRDTSDWTVCMENHRWYLRLYYMMVDAAIHSEEKEFYFKATY
jgi:hypothetical protein